MIKLAKANNPSANFIVKDCRTFNTIERKFDIAISGFFFPYLSKSQVIQFIEDSSKTLTRDGLLYISTMEDKHSESGLTKGSTGDEIYMHYNEESFLSEVLAGRYFEVVYSERIKSVASDDTDTTDLILVSRKIR